jgi:hypothetical protein
MTDDSAPEPQRKILPCPHCGGEGQLVRAQRQYVRRRPQSNAGAGYRGPTMEFEGFQLTPAMVQTIKLVRAGVHTRAGIEAGRGTADFSAGSILRKLVADNWLWTPQYGVYCAFPGEGPQLSDIEETHA